MSPFLACHPPSCPGRKYVLDNSFSVIAFHAVARPHAKEGVVFNVGSNVLFSNLVWMQPGLFVLYVTGTPDYLEVSNGDLYCCLQGWYWYLYARLIASQPASHSTLPQIPKNIDARKTDRSQMVESHGPDR